MLINNPIFYGYYENGYCWIRFSFLGRKGFYVKDTTKAKLLFSERNGIKKTYRVGKYLIGILK
jgi:hypothetical protein